MRFVLFGVPGECSLLKTCLQQYCTELELAEYDRQDEMITGVMQHTCDAVFVLHDSALGMEGAIAVRKLLPRIPLFWLSNDQAFAIQSYRLGVTWFGVKPFSAQSIHLALSKCGLCTLT